MYFLSLLLTRTSLPLLVHHGTAMRECGMTRGTQGTGVEVHTEKEVPGVVLVALTLALHLGTHMISSHHGGTSQTSLRGARGSPHFPHACRHVDNYCDQISMYLYCIVYSTFTLYHCSMTQSGLD